MINDQPPDWIWQFKKLFWNRESRDITDGWIFGNDNLVSSQKGQFGKDNFVNDNLVSSQNWQFGYDNFVMTNLVLTNFVMTIW